MPQMKIFHGAGKQTHRELQACLESRHFRMELFPTILLIHSSSLSLNIYILCHLDVILGQTWMDSTWWSALDWRTGWVQRELNDFKPLPFQHVPTWVVHLMMHDFLIPLFICLSVLLFPTHSSRMSLVVKTVTTNKFGTPLPCSGESKRTYLSWTGERRREGGRLFS